MNQTQDLQQQINFKFQQSQSQITETIGLNMCEPVIPDNQVTRFSFQIINAGYGVWIGICNSNQKPDFTKIGHGCYLIYNDGCCLSHHCQELHLKYKSFEFVQGSIIKVEVDMKKRKITFNQTMSMDLEQSEYYPCVYLGLIAKVKILQ